MFLKQHFQSRYGFLVVLLIVALVSFLAVADLPTVAKEATEESGAASQMPQAALPELELAIGQQIYRVEVASTHEQTQKGLMFRKELPARHGMLFLFQPARVVQFWMKNTYIPLDMLFLSQGRITYIARNVPPCQAMPCPSYGPKTHSDMVVELPAGTADADRIMPGDRVRVIISQNLSSSPKADAPRLKAASSRLDMLPLER